MNYSIKTDQRLRDMEGGEARASAQHQAPGSL